jgi:uncharacterized membrane protein YadS
MAEHRVASSPRAGVPVALCLPVVAIMRHARVPVKHLTMPAEFSLLLAFRKSAEKRERDEKELIVQSGAGNIVPWFIVRIITVHTRKTE